MNTFAHPTRPLQASMGAVDRYLISDSDPGVLAYFLNRLFVPHGLRERGLMALLKTPVRHRARDQLIQATWRVESTPYRLSPDGGGHFEEEVNRWAWAASLIRVLEETPDALRAAGFLPFVPGRSIVLRDSREVGRGRVIVFVFSEVAEEPSAVIKLRDSASSGPVLRQEHDALLQVRRSQEMVSSTPEPLFYQDGAKAEILVLSGLPGVSAYVEMQSAMRPARRVGAHFKAAGDWLARFHRTSDPSPIQGDFWARNLLLRPLAGQGAGVSVVDWEHAVRDGDPLQDLVHFPVSYAVNYPWRRYRRIPAAEAFRRTFLEPGGLGGHVVRYFRHYFEATGLERERLRPGLLSYLAKRAQVASQEEAGEWRACADALRRAGGTEVVP